MLVSYHNHTNWSDGTPTAAEQIAAAAESGLDELGLSDHFVDSPHGPISWSMPLDRLGEYVTSVHSAGAQCRALRVRVGVEADYFPETVDRVRAALQAQPLDFVVGSVHFVDSFPLDSYAEDWQPLGQQQVDDVWRAYWRLIREMALSGVYDFAGHLDLPKKFGYLPAEDLSTDEGTALDAVAAAGMAIEINTAGWHKPIAEQYPSLRLLREARQRNIPLLINADAHETAHLTRDFDRAREVARDAGYTELVRYEARRAHSIPL